jgi:polygalacturonase
MIVIPRCARDDRGLYMRITSLLLVLASSALAQDTRTVVEPKFPAACTTLSAELIPDADTTLFAADENKYDTQRIQKALDGCAAGRAVFLEATGNRRAFLSGPLTIKAGVTLVIDTNATVFASRNPRDYDTDQPGRCGTVDARGRGCKALITTDRATSAGVMGPGTIDGRGWAKLIGRDSSWWDLAQAARAGGSQNCPRLIQINRSDDFTVYKLTLKNSPNFHVVYDRGNGFTAWGVVINTTDKWARNTDGIDPSSAKNVTITRSYINTGDDNIAIKAGSNGPSTNITISHNHFYRGHGVSIGSETDGGASAIRVFDLSIEGADNGLRIKSNASRGGLVHDVEYKDVCIRNSKNVIEMDAFYTASPQTTGTLIPEFRDIRLKGVRVLDAGRVILQGYDAVRPLRMSWDNVVFDQPSKIKVTAKNAIIAQGPSNLRITGENVQVTGTATSAPPVDCDGKFVAFPK